MTARTWLTVYATLADVLILSQPYDAEGGFALLHDIDASLEGSEFRGSIEANRSHVLAALDAKRQYLEAARRSMICIAMELERLRKTEV